MKLLLVLAFIILSKISFGQDLENQKTTIDAEVQQIAKQTQLKTKLFSIQALKKVLHYIHYQYIENSKGYVKIHRQFSHNNDSIQQTFFLKNGTLIYAREKITTYYIEKDKRDSISWIGDFYFAKGKLIDYITIGHGKSEIDTWDPEQDMLTAFSESKRDIARYKKKKAAGDKSG